MKTYIGVDLGGTNVRVAKVDETGAILQIVKEPTEIDVYKRQVYSCRCEVRLPAACEELYDAVCLLG